jgi:hypothetical protein
MKTANKLLAALCLALVACLALPAMMPVGMNNPFTAQAAAAINKTRATIYNGKTLQLKVKGTTRTVSWSSSDDKVAKVNQKGLVTALKVGKATITAKVGSKNLTCKVTVKSPLSADALNLNLDVGATKYVTLTYKLNGKLSLKKYDSSVLNCTLGKISPAGKCTLTIKTLRPGTQTLVISNSKTSDTVKIKVTVRERQEPTGPIVDKTSVTLGVGEIATVKVTWPYGGEPQMWFDNSSVVDCTWGAWENDGWPLYIKGVGVGTANVWFVKADDPAGDILATIKVTVK